MFCCTLFCVHSSIAIILMGKRELVALLNLSSWCLVMVERLFLAVPRGCLRFVIVVFPDYTHLLFLLWNRLFQNLQILQAFARHYSNTKNELFEAFFQSFQVTKLLYAIIKIKRGFLMLDPSGSLKPSPFMLGFQHHPRGPADVNA